MEKNELEEEGVELESCGRNKRSKGTPWSCIYRGREKELGYKT